MAAWEAAVCAVGGLYLCVSGPHSFAHRARSRPSSTLPHPICLAALPTLPATTASAGHLTEFALVARVAEDPSVSCQLDFTPWDGVVGTCLNVVYLPSLEENNFHLSFISLPYLHHRYPDLPLMYLLFEYLIARSPPAMV
jgi:hypothetical protein